MILYIYSVYTHTHTHTHTEERERKLWDSKNYSSQLVTDNPEIVYQLSL